VKARELAGYLALGIVAVAMLPVIAWQVLGAKT